MKPCRTLSDIYGQLSGYHRLEIRREARLSCRSDIRELAARSGELFSARVRGAVALFPAYAALVRRHAGRVPAPADRITTANLPVWTREHQRRLFESLKGPPVPGSFVHATGGSTGMPTRFYVTRESYEWRTAVSDRGYSWAGAEEGRRSFYVWGEPASAGSLLKRVKTGVHHFLQSRTYFDSWTFEDAKKMRCMDGINRMKPEALVGYAGNLVELARFARDNPGLLEWKAKTIVTAAEGLHEGQRELLEEHLADKVFMSYGSREFMLIGMECGEHKGYHVASDNLFVEVVRDDGTPADPGETGRILVTDLRNAANPFIRYEIGDLGAMTPPDYRCRCGLPFPVLARVDGRIQERIQLPDGSSMTALFMPHIMKEFKWVEGYQVVQEAPNRVYVNVISPRELSEEAVAPLKARLQERMGTGMTIEFARVEALRKSDSGKTPIVVKGEGETKES